jgi:hypothetical protein
LRECYGPREFPPALVLVLYEKDTSDVCARKSQYAHRLLMHVETR